MLLSVLLFAAALSNEPAPPVGETAPAAQAAAPAPVAEVQMVCRRERVTGSNRMERICRSKAQIQAERDARETRFGQGLSSADRAPLTFKPVTGRE
jgi:hypothetical protein